MSSSDISTSSSDDTIPDVKKEQPGYQTYSIVLFVVVFILFVMVWYINSKTDIKTWYNGLVTTNSKWFTNVNTIWVLGAISILLTVWGVYHMSVSFSQERLKGFYGAGLASFVSALIFIYSYFSESRDLNTAFYAGVVGIISQLIMGYFMYDLIKDGKESYMWLLSLMPVILVEYALVLTTYS